MTAATFERLAKVALVASILGVIWLALRTPGPGPGLIPWDKAAHAIAFYIHTLLAIAAFPRARPWTLVAWLLGWGVALEAAQALSGTGRVASVWDVAADAVGVAMAFAPRWIEPVRERLLRKSEVSR